MPSGRPSLHAFLLVTGLLISSGQVSPAPESPRTLEEYRQFALYRDGDISRGKALFKDEQRLACTRCHSVDGKGGKAGPDLFSVGEQFPRRYLIDALVRPSEVIAVGYSTTIVETREGDQYHGVLKQSTHSIVELACADGQRTSIPKEDIKEQRGSTLSLMPEGLQAGLSLQEFTDLVEYLVSLKESANSLVTHQGMPNSIPVLAQPIQLRPLLPERLRFADAGAQVRTNVQPGLIWFAQIPGFPNAFLALDQAGIIWRMEVSPAPPKVTVFADFTSEVFSARGPNGLLGFAFHPQFAKNRRYYLKHQVFEQKQIATVLAEKIASPDCLHDSGAASRRLLYIPAGAEHHNGGCIQFGPDGFLYFGMGDSAPNHDPQGYGQDMGLLLGKMLRIDLDRSENGLPYAIPVDNPFRGCGGARPEIWALGLREPWRFSFDSVTGDLWVGDLGQERGDEVSIVRRGENHGWNIYEGFELFSKERRRQAVSYIPPIFASRRKHGCTVVGGYVYRADPKSPFYGQYIFGDYTSKRIWTLTHENRSLKTIEQIATCPESITAFSIDEAGRVYVVGYEGMIYRLEI